MTERDAIGTTKPQKNPNHTTSYINLYQSMFVSAPPVLKKSPPVSSLVVFGNGRTHTGEVDGSGGSRLANYCLGASVSYRDNERPLRSQVEKHLKDVIIQ